MKGGGINLKEQALLDNENEIDIVRQPDNHVDSQQLKYQIT